MSLGYAVRLGIKYTFSRKRSTIIFTVLLLLSMILCGTLLQTSRTIQSATVEAIHAYYPDIILLGYFSPGITSIAENIEDVEEVVCIRAVNVMVKGERGAWPAILAYGESLYSGGLFAVASTARPRGLEVLLTPLAAYELGVREGDVVRVCYGAFCVDARVAGYYSSIASIGSGIVLLGTDILLSKLNVSYCNMLAMGVREDVDVREVVDKVIDTVRRSEGVVKHYYVVAKDAEVLSRTAAIEGMTLSVTSSLVLSIVFIALASAALSIVGLEREFSTIGVLRAVGLTSKQIIVVYSFGKILVVFISTLVAICLTPILGYGFSLILLNSMGFEASLVKPFVELTVDPNIIIREVVLFAPIPSALLLVPGLIAQKISVVQALNPFLSSNSYTARSSPRILSWSPWFMLLTRRLSRAIVYIVVLALLATPLFAIGMLNAGYAVRTQYASSLDFDTVVYTSPQYYEVLRRAFRGVQVLTVNTSWSIVDGYAVLINYIDYPELLVFVAPLVEGRYPQFRGEAVVTMTIAKLLGVQIGDKISIEGRDYRVVGIVRYYVNNELVIFVYEYGGGSQLVYYIKDIESSEVRSVLEESGVPAKVISVESYAKSIASGTSMVLGIISTPLLLAYLVLLGGLLLILAVDLMVNSHHIVVLKCIGIRSRDTALWVVKALLPLLPISTLISLVAAYVLSNSIAVALAQSFAYDPPKLTATALVPGLVSTFLVALLAGYTVALIVVKKMKTSSINLLAV